MVSKMSKNENSKINAFLAKHAEIWKFVKFSIVGMSSTFIELIIYYILQGVVFKDMNTEPFKFLIFEYEGIGYMWAFLISTTIGYAIAFVLNRKATFKADANPALSIFLYIVMVVFTIFATTWMGTALLNFFIDHGWRSAGEILAKPIVATIATVWTYPTNRFIIHRKKKTTEENKKA